MSNDEYSFYSSAAVAIVFDMSFCQSVNLWQDRAWRRKRENEIKGERGIWLEASEWRERRRRRSSVRLWTEPLWSPLRSPVFKESCGLRRCLASLIDPRTEIGESAHILWLLRPPTPPPLLPVLYTSSLRRLSRRRTIHWCHLDNWRHLISVGMFGRAARMYSNHQINKGSKREVWALVWKTEHQGFGVKQK